MLQDWYFWFTTLTAIVAILALLQTERQIKLSNKQSLFDHRLNIYLKFSEMTKLYKDNLTLLTDCKCKNDICYDVDFIFIMLTNNTYLEAIGESIKHPLEQQYHINFLKKCEEMRTLAKEANYAFLNKAASSISNFINGYQELIFKIYQYQINLNKLKEKSNAENRIINNDQSENKLRKELFDAIDNLNKFYDITQDKKIKKEIEKQIRIA